ncbi:MAG: hypothetical protein ACRYE9_00230, partial [Janthinobacterium lividum]
MTEPTPIPSTTKPTSMLSSLKDKLIAGSSIISEDDFKELSKEEQIRYLVTLSDGKLAATDLSDDLLVPAFTIYSSSYMLRKVGQEITNIAGPTTQYFTDAVKTLKEALDKANHDKRTQNNILAIFNQKIVRPINSLIEKLSEAPNKANELVYSSIVVRGAVQVLEGVLAFRKSMDRIFTPAVSDRIVTAGVNAIVGVIATQVPIVGITLKLSGLPTMIADSFKVQNLQKNIDSLKSKIAEVKQDKTVRLQYVLAEKISELENVVGISKENLQKLSLSLKTVEDIISKKDNPEYITEVQKTLNAQSQLVESVDKSKLSPANEVGISKENLQKPNLSSKTVEDIISKKDNPEHIAEVQKILNAQSQLVESVNKSKLSPANKEEFKKIIESEFSKLTGSEVAQGSVTDNKARQTKVLEILKAKAKEYSKPLKMPEKEIFSRDMNQAIEKSFSTPASKLPTVHEKSTKHRRIIYNKSRKVVFTQKP